MRVYVEALKSGRTENPQPHLLLIEEINRAKVAAVFGDVFQLLDRMMMESVNMKFRHQRILENILPHN